MTASPLSIAERLLAALPQTQCTRCGYPDCASYAQAMASGQADINQCPPGGQAGVARLGAIIGRPPLDLNPLNGSEGPRMMAHIDEDWCIGCTLCIKACPVDAIVGANKRMHTVIESHCTGCELCLPVCPVDCINLENVSGSNTGWQAWSAEQADSARYDYAAHLKRLEKTPAQSALPAVDAEPYPTSAGTPTETVVATVADTVAKTLAQSPVQTPAQTKQAVIAAALASARQQRKK